MEMFDAVRVKWLYLYPKYECLDGDIRCWKGEMMILNTGRA